MKRLSLFLLTFPTLLLANEEQPPIGEYNFASEFVRMLSILGAMIAALLVISWILKQMMNSRMEKMNDESEIHILERRPIGPKAALYLVEVEGTKMVVAESPNGLTHLTNLDSTEKEPTAHELV